MDPGVMITSRFHKPHPDASLICQTLDTALMYCTTFLLPAFNGMHCAYLQRDGHVLGRWCPVAY